MQRLEKDGRFIETSFGPGKVLEDANKRTNSDLNQNERVGGLLPSNKMSYLPM